MCTAPGVLNMQGLQAVVEPGVGDAHAQQGVLARAAGAAGRAANSVREVVRRWLACLPASVLVCFLRHLAGTADVVQRASGQGRPLVENTLGASLAACVRRQVGVDSLKGREAFLTNVGVLASGDSWETCPASR